MKQVDLETTAGTIRVELDDEKAPGTVKNFINNVENGHYDNTIFRLDPQTNKITSVITPVAGPTGVSFGAGSLWESEAHNSAPHSATAQFFINAADNEFLNFKSETQQGWGYAVFGRVVKGQEVVDAIERVRTGNRAGHSDVPIDDVTITRATVVS